MRRILKSTAESEDALQDASVQVWKRSHSFDPKRGTVAAWLLTVARTRALDRYRSAASRGRAESQVDPAVCRRRADPSNVAAQSAPGRACVRAALNQLQPQQRQVLEIAYFEGLSQSAIASRPSAPLGTVKSWTRQGLMRLKELLPQEEWV